MAQNCWEFRKCGRGPGSAGVGKSICPTGTIAEFNGVNQGQNGGRYCWMVIGTFCDGSAQCDKEYKKINCLLCDFYHQVRDEQGKEFQDGETTVNENMAEIKRILKQAFDENETLEVQVDHQPRVFYTQILDEVPPLLEIVDENGEAQTIEPPYVPTSYLDDGDHLLLFPLTPALGNAMIRRSESLVIRLYQEVKAIEAEVVFQGVVQTRNEAGLRLSFPDKLRIFRKRRYRRFAFPPEIRPRLIIEANGKTFKALACIDMSTGGLGFNIAEVDNCFAVDDCIQVSMTCVEPELNLTLKGYLRKTEVGFRLKSGKITSIRCGLQFDINDLKTEDKVQDLVCALQRAHLRRMKDANEAQGAMAVVARARQQEPMRELLQAKSRFFNKLFD